MKDKPLRVEIIDDELRVSVGISTLAYALENAPYSYNFSDYVDEDGNAKLRITDEAGFAKEVLHELLCEQEDGATPISTLLDKMMVSAIENGSICVEETKPELTQ